MYIRTQRALAVGVSGTCIQEEKDMEVLKLYLKKASRVQSVEEFEQWVLKERNKKM